MALLKDGQQFLEINLPLANGGKVPVARPADVIFEMAVNKVRQCVFEVLLCRRAVVEVDIKYRRPGRLGDDLQVVSTV